MNPRGRQFALGGKLTSWTRRESFSSAEATTLRRCFAGREPRTFSRYGIRQWAAPLPSTTVIIKDPFALLSIRAIHEVTDTVPVLLYRHPAAVLASYRRMGWTADTDELVSLGAPAPAGPTDLEAMATMWSFCHETALADVHQIEGAVVVSHHALTIGAEDAHAALCRRLGIEFRPDTQPSGPLEPPMAVATSRRDGVLHDFDRSAESVATDWRGRLHPDEIAQIEEAVAPVWAALESRQLDLPTQLGTKDDPS
jgi:hypothetical protein